MGNSIINIAYPGCLLRNQEDKEPGNIRIPSYLFLPVLCTICIVVGLFEGFVGYRGIVLPMYNFQVCPEYNLCTTLRMYYINIIKGK